MTAGSGITHSEMNASDGEPVHFYQIWIIPEQTDLTPAISKNRLMPKPCKDPFILLPATEVLKARSNFTVTRRF